VSSFLADGAFGVALGSWRSSRSTRTSAVPASVRETTWRRELGERVAHGQRRPRTGPPRPSRISTTVLRASLLVVTLATVVLSACTAPQVIIPTATATATVGTTTSPSASWTVFYARDLDDPIAVTVRGPSVPADPAARVKTRLELLASARVDGPDGSFNVVGATKTRRARVMITGDVVSLDYDVPGDDWALHGSATFKAFLQQVVFTPTVEKGIPRMLITQNGGKQAVIGRRGFDDRRPAHTRERAALIASCGGCGRPTRVGPETLVARRRVQDST
jgi:hypothetical protein